MKKFFLGLGLMGAIIAWVLADPLISGSKRGTTTGGSGENQSPWLTDINGGGFSLSNVSSIYVTPLIGPTRSVLGIAETNGSYFQWWLGPFNLSNHLYTIWPTSAAPAAGYVFGVTNVTAGGTGATNVGAWLLPAAGGTPAGGTGDLQKNAGGGSFGAITSPSTTTGRGYRLQFDGTNAAWAGPASGWTWIIDEEFVGDGATGNRVGREAWNTALNGGGVVGNDTANNGAGFIGAPGVLRFIVTNAADRATVFIGPSATAVMNIRLTNIEAFCIVRVRIGLTNDATDANGLEIGLMDQVSAAPTYGIYWRCSNNVFTAVNMNNASSTTGTASNLVAAQYETLAWHLDSTGTNVIFYQGASATTLTPMVTNMLNIPQISVGPAIRWTKLGGTTNRMTNYVDYFKLGTKRL